MITSSEEKENEMKLDQACDIITDLAADHGEGVLETLVYMRDNLDDFSEREVLAFRLFMNAGQRMFAPKEAA
jgi:hypothetical protein